MQKIINILKGYEHKIRYEFKTHQLSFCFGFLAEPVSHSKTLLSEVVKTESPEHTYTLKTHITSYTALHFTASHSTALHYTQMEKYGGTGVDRRERSAEAAPSHPTSIQLHLNITAALNFAGFQFIGP